MNKTNGDNFTMSVFELRCDYVNKFKWHDVLHKGINDIIFKIGHANYLVYELIRCIFELNSRLFKKM
jgi:hypothetical protein